MGKLWRVLKSGSFWGFLATVLGGLSGPPVLNVLPTKWAGVLIVGGAFVSALSQAIHQAARAPTPE